MVNDKPSKLHVMLLSEGVDNIIVQVVPIKYIRESAASVAVAGRLRLQFIHESGNSKRVAFRVQ